jgi:hypothetical protein
MTIKSEFDKLAKAKSEIRKSIQRKGTGLTLDEIFMIYPQYINGMSDQYTPDESNLINYIEDRVYFLETSAKVIRPFAFKEFTCLQQLYLSSTTVVDIKSLNAFSGTIPEILVPEPLLTEYQHHPIWSTISNRIKPYTEGSDNEMFLLQHINQVQTLGWLQNHTLGQLSNEFRF